MRSISLASFVLLATAGAAAAQPGATPAPVAPPAPAPSTEEKIISVAVAELKRTEKVPHKGLLVSLHAGYHGDVAGMGELRLGFGTGTSKESLLFPTTKLWRFSVAGRGAYGKEDSLSLSALAGRSHVGFAGYSLEAGLDARVIGDGDPVFGPIVSLGIRFTKLGLHTNVWTHFVEDDNDWGFSIALGMNMGDYVSPADIAKKRAKARIKEEILKRI
jgi:hypothetical protein